MNETLTFLKAGLTYPGLASVLPWSWGWYSTSDPPTPLLLCAEMAGVSLSTLIIFKGVLRIKTQVSCMPGNTLSMCYTLNCNISNFINGYKVNATTSRYGTHQKKKQNKKKISMTSYPDAR